jgi:hypothetical protein
MQRQGCLARAAFGGINHERLHTPNLASRRQDVKTSA